MQEGDLVEVRSADGEFLALGHYGGRDIAVKILSFEPVEDWNGFWDAALGKAYKFRRGLKFETDCTNAFRLVNGEGDFLPGLIIDLYGQVAVLQCQSAGMERARFDIAEALSRLPGNPVEAVYWKKIGRENGGRAQGEYLKGHARPGIVHENGLKFLCDWELGQKTGFYLDQRENRRLVECWSAGRRVLNAFCYTGAFSVYALRGGAASVCSIDASKDAIENAGKNIEMNFPGAVHKEQAGDCFQLLEQLQEEYDLVVVDPPAFAKHKKALQRGLQGYEKINYLAFSKISSGGLLFTFSCSQLVTEELFERTVRKAAADARRNIRIFAKLGQAPCHPVSLSHPEGRYLKGLALHVQ